LTDSIEQHSERFCNVLYSPKGHLLLPLSLPLLIVLHASTSSAMSPQSRIEEAEQEQSAMQAENSRLSAELKVCAIL